MGCSNSNPVKNPIKNQSENRVTPEVIVKKSSNNLSIKSFNSISISNRNIIIGNMVSRGNDPILIMSPSKPKSTTREPEKIDKEIQTDLYSLESEFCLKYGIKDPNLLKKTLNYMTFQALNSPKNLDSKRKTKKKSSFNPNFAPSIEKEYEKLNEKRKVPYPSFGGASINIIKNNLNQKQRNLLEDNNSEEEDISKKENRALTESSSSDLDISASRIKVRVPLAFEKQDVNEFKQNETLRFENEDKLGVSTDDIALLHRKKYKMLNDKQIQLDGKEKIVEKIQKLDISHIPKENSGNQPHHGYQVNIKKVLEEVNEEDDKSSGKNSINDIIKTLKGSNRDMKAGLNNGSFNSESDSASYFTMKKVGLAGKRKESGFSKKSKYNQNSSKKDNSKSFKRSETHGVNREKSRFGEYLERAKKLVGSNREIPNHQKIIDRRLSKTPQNK